MWGRRSLVLCLALLAGRTAAQEAEPFRVRNLNPLAAIFGLPAWDTVRPGVHARATAEIANHYRFSARGADRLLLDGETLRTTLSLSYGFSERWTIGAELPYFQVTGGQLDDLIDGWHSAFGLPDGGRNNRPEGAVLFELGDAQGPFFGFDRRARGLGDVQLKVARTLGAGHRFTLQGTLKLPTGDEDVLAGSGSADVGITLLHQREITVGDRAGSFYWGAGVLHAGDPERIEFAAESTVSTGILGGSLQIGPRFGVKAQLDFHGPFFNSPLEEIGEKAILATAGAWFRAGSRSLLEFAIVEDLEVSTAPDVVIHVAAHWTW
jgi:hypothetical protein